MLIFAATCAEVGSPHRFVGIGRKRGERERLSLGMGKSGGAWNERRTLGFGWSRDAECEGRGISARWRRL